jgi:hypothetical protein
MPLEPQDSELGDGFTRRLTPGGSPHHPELAGLEAALSALTPVCGRINRDALLFRAGQASVRTRGWAWPCATAALGLLAAVLGVIVAVRPVAIERVVVTIREPAPAVSQANPTPAQTMPHATAGTQPATSPMNYMQLERQVLRWGLDGIPNVPEAPASNPLMTRGGFLGSAADSPAPSDFFSLESLFQ